MHSAMNYFKSWHPQGNGSRPLAHDQVQDDTCGVVHQFLRSDKAQSVAREICPISHSVFLSWTPRSKSPHRKSLVKFTHLSCCIFFALLVLVDVEASHFLNALPSLNEGMCIYICRSKLTGSMIGPATGFAYIAPLALISWHI